MLSSRFRFISSVGKLLGTQNLIGGHGNHRQFSSAPVHRTFQDIIDERRLQAQRSIVVQVASQQSYPELYQYCSQWSQIKNTFYYTIPDKSPRNYILLEFDTIDAVKRAYNSSFLGDFASGATPVESPFFWFKYVNEKNKTVKDEPPLPLNTTHRIIGPTNAELTAILSKAASISHQMELLYKNTRLNEISIRLRFLGAHQIERILNGLLSKSSVMPFGSTVNGFGKMESDLDMILQYNSDQLQPAKDLKTRRLINHVKLVDFDDTGEKKREMIRKHLRVFASIFESFMPGAVDVSGIYSARVPIIRYYHDYLHVDADISITNMTGFYVSELFHMLGEMDQRVRPLVFTVRRWTQDFPNKKQSKTLNLSSFIWTTLVLGFLQQLKKPILPPVNQLIEKTRPVDIRPSQDDRPYSFLRDLNELQFQTKNTSTLEELFMQFLEFYGTFDFSKHMISLKTGKSNQKPEFSPLQIMNPFEVDQNWARNVPQEGCAIIKYQAQQALSDFIFLIDESKKNKEQWGLLELFDLSTK